MTQQQNVLSWLKDAHAMEEGAILTLTNHAAAVQNYPEVQSKLYEHAEATRRHADLVKGCIERLGGHPSALKEAIGSVIGKVQGVAALPAQDTVVKNALGDFAAEHFEIACYSSLIAAAETTGDYETVDACRKILHEEEEMAGWLGGQIPGITQKFLTEQAGEDDGSAQGSVLDSVKERVKGLGEQGRLAANVAGSDKKDALIVSGALLAGAGAALLLTQALRSGSGDKQEQQADGDASAGASDEVDTGYIAASGSDAGQSDLFYGANELQGEGVGSSELNQDVDAPVISLLSEEDVVEVPSQDAEPFTAPDLQTGDQNLSELLEEDAQTAMVSDLQGGALDTADALVYTEVWLVPGPYSGLGPKGYDSAGDPVGQEVYSRLAQHGQVDASNIEIVIDNGEVLLEGTVDSEETKRLAQEAIESILDVSSVQNLLQVQGNGNV